MNGYGVRRKWRIENGAWIMGLSIFYFLFSQSAVLAISDNAGTSNGAFLKIPTDARGVALGAPMASMAEGLEGMRWNPAALGMTESKELDATQIEYYQSVSIQNVGAAYPLEEGAVAVNAFYLSAGSLDGRDTSGAPTGNFAFYDLVGGMGYGRRILSQDESGVDLYAGGAVKIVQEKIADTQNQNPALDLGLILLPFDSMRTGLSVRNLSTHRADYPKEITGSASYTLLQRFTGGLGVTYADDAAIRFGASGECRFPELEGAVLRAGYQSHDALDSSTDSQIPALRGASLAGLTMGAGLEYRPPIFKTLRLQLDYAMAPFGALGISHTLTVKVKW